MKTDKLIEAFGEIDEDIFCEENVSSDKSEDEPTVITVSGKKRKNPRPYLIGAAVMALVAAVPMIMLASKKNIEPERIPAATDNDGVTSVSADAAQSQTREMSFENIIAESNCIVRARFVSCEDRGDSYNYTFSTIETIKDKIGGAVGDEFQISRNKEYDNEQRFTEGEYILPLTCADSVYFDAPVFTVTSNAVIPCDNNAITSISVDGLSVQIPENLTKVSDFVEYVNSIEDRSEPLFKEYITSASLNDIAEQSDYIVKAVISGDPLRSGEDRGIYTCSLTQGYKGDVEETFEALFLYDSVEVGEEYYFFLTKNQPSSAFYIVSSKNSIYRSDDSNVAEALKNCGINGNDKTGFKIIEGTPLTADKLADFKLEEYYNPDELGFKSMKDFLDGLDCTYKAELKSLYWRAHLLSFKELSSGTDFVPRLDIESRATLEDEKSNMTFFETGFTYDSFYGNYTNVFTKETADKILKMYPWFLSYNEELWIMGVSRGGNYTQLPHEEYEVLTQTDTELTIQRTLYYYDWVSAGEEYVFDPDKKDLYSKGYSECKFVLTEEGWRIETFFDTLKGLEETKQPTVKINDEEFTFTIEGEPMAADKLVDYNLEEYHEPDTWTIMNDYIDFIDGLDCSYKEELKDLYWKAKVLSFFETNAAMDNFPWHKTPVPYEERAHMYLSDGTPLIESGFTYDSFYRNYLDVFTEETAKKILEYCPWTLSYNNELWVMGISGGGYYTQLPHEEYEVLNQTDKELVIRRTLFFYDWVSAGEEYAFDPDKKDLYVKTYSECKFVLTDDGWRIETFFDTLKSIEERNPFPETNTSEEDSSETSAAPASDISEAYARAAALAHAGIEEADAYFIKTKLDYDNGKAEYDIEFTAGGYRYEYEIDASSGAVLEYSSEKSPVQPADFISDEKARSIALEHCGVSPEQAFGVKTELDEEDGEFEVKFNANGFEYEVKLDARTGTVLESEMDD